MTGHGAPRPRLEYRQVWEAGTLVTEMIADEEPTAHYVADPDNGHGHQITANPETACGRIVPNSMLADAEYEDFRCVECLTRYPDAEPYPAAPVIVALSCPVCPDGGQVTHEDGTPLCYHCGTQWPNEHAPGVRSYPPHVDEFTGLPTTGDGQAALTPRTGTIDVGLPLDPPVVRDTIDGEAVLHPDAYLVQPGMRIACSHDHPQAWSLVLTREDGPPEVVDDGRILNGGDDPDDPTSGAPLTHEESTVRFTLACGGVVDLCRTDGVAVVVDAPLPTPPTAEADESDDA